MDKDNDWVEDVKRWCRAGGASTARGTTASAPAEDDTPAYGYEAADPAVQARHWPSVATSFATLPMSR